MRRDLVVDPTQYDPERDNESAIVANDDMALDTFDDVTQQRVAVDRLRPRLDDPVAIKRRDLSILASRLDLVINGLGRYGKFFGCGLALADVVQTFRLGERIQQFILAAFAFAFSSSFGSLVSSADGGFQSCASSAVRLIARACRRPLAQSMTSPLGWKTRQHENAYTLGNAGERSADDIDVLPSGVIIIGNEDNISTAKKFSCVSGFHFFAPPLLHVAATLQDQSISALRSPSTTRTG